MNSAPRHVGAKGETVLVLGATGLVGSGIARALEAAGRNVVGVSTADADLRDVQQVKDLLDEVRPELVIHAAGRVGGIEANLSRGLQLGLDNALMTTNVLAVALELGIDELIYLASSCCYPNDRAERMDVDQLFAGPIEESSRAYALSKALGIELVTRAHQDGRSWVNVIPANVYGPFDNFDLAEAHVVAALMRRFHEAKLSSAASLALWGTGSPLRQFVHSKDVGRAIVLISDQLSQMPAVVNVAGEGERSIAQLATEMAGVVGLAADIVWDPSHPDGTPVKLLDDTPLRELGWRPEFDLRRGLEDTYQWLTAAIEAGEARGYPAAVPTSSAGPSA